VSGRVISEPTSQPHYCDPPRTEIRDSKSDENVENPFDMSLRRDVYVWPRVGTIWECECGRRWRALWEEGQSGPNLVSCGFVRWDLEPPEVKADESWIETVPGWSAWMTAAFVLVATAAFIAYIVASMKVRG
jgi:hypothetical protein